MPDHLLYAYGIRREVAGFPAHIRRAAELAILGLLDDPVPPHAKPFIEDLGHASYELPTEYATIYYLVIDDTVMITKVLPNT
ncbi:hypothetical protein SAMN04489712_13331 [Thermomonospora echinospora]|uniref:Type II toxin-antitoxin system RelE/ParE family toxin n=1 Tax=Thermomonospora echinospora TaxID=1992 RepID=A0A1H6E405_9ACTN|nr:hypothetical protein [Thermomonospora echinospora]SEG92372.1 hypothetical protein SAMN04489712_13331 [Thermomonospora echinospora]